MRCIRCGSCINYCPVYVQLGGHAYGTVYPGPIGIALEPQRIGLDQVGCLTSACTLCGNRPQTLPPPPVYRQPRGWNRERCIGEFTERMQAVRGEVHRLDREQWVDWINREMPARGLHRALVGNSAIGRRFAAGAAKAIALSRYDKAIEEWKGRLFRDIDFAITGSLAGLAESGSLVLWPDAEEPRLLSLVPPLHIVLLEAERLYENFAQLIDVQRWADGMPTNALLISGPSKTADIEQTLAYGIHGPKALITLILE